MKTKKQLKAELEASRAELAKTNTALAEAENRSEDDKAEIAEMETELAANKAAIKKAEDFEKEVIARKPKEISKEKAKEIREKMLKRLNGGK